MRRSLGTLLLLALTPAGCGSDDGSTVEPEGPDGEAAQVVLLSASDAHGRVDLTATPLPDEAAVSAFTAGLGERLAAEVAEAAGEADVPEGQSLYGAVVALGCEVPTDVEVTRSGDEVVLTPRIEKADPPIQCYVPVTTVALVVAGQGV